MDFENEKKQEEQSAQEQQGSREGYQKDYRPAGRSPRPRIHTGQRPVQTGYERPSFNKHDDEGGFRPEGFGAGLQSQPAQHSGFRPRPNNYQPRQQHGGYQPRQPKEEYGQPPWLSTPS